MKSTSSPRLRRTRLLLAGIGLTALSATAQNGLGPSDALQWTTRLERGAGTDELTLVLEASIAEGYIVYGSDFTAELGPRPSRLRLDAGAPVQADGGLASVASKRRKDKNLGTEYSYFEGRAEYRQRLRRTATSGTVSGRIEGQTCFETDGTCTLFRQTFSLPLP